jgi:hypothetical protein
VHLHLALVGRGHIHPKLPAAGLTRAIDTGHIIAVIVLLWVQRQPKHEESGRPGATLVLPHPDFCI